MRRLVVVLTVVIVVAGGIEWSPAGAAKVPFSAVGVASCRAVGKVKFSPGLAVAARPVRTTVTATLTCSQGTTGRAGVTIVSGKLKGSSSLSSLACSAGTVVAASAATVKWKAPGAKLNRSAVAWPSASLAANGTLDFSGAPPSTVTGSYAGRRAGLHLVPSAGPGAACSAKKGWKGYTFAAATSTFAISPPPAAGYTDFYVPPSPLPPGNPGDVIRSEPTTVYLTPSQPAAATAWRVLFRSTSATGTPIAVSGTIIVPTASYPGTRPVVVYAPPTVGNGDQCATSKALAAGSAPDGPIYGFALAQGWAVVQPDYEGLGTPAQHTYLVGRSQGHAVLDIARAATRLPAAGLSSAAHVAILGYSQGGQSASWAAQLQPTYAPELPLVGVAAGGTPSNLEPFAAANDGGQNFGFIPSMLIGYDAAYPELDLSSYLNAEGQTTFADTATQCYLAYLANLGFRSLTELTTSNPLATAAWQTRLAENALGSLAPAVPMYLFHGTNDEIVPYAQGEALETSYCNAAVTVQFVSLAGANHVSAYAFNAGNAVSWIASRFAGSPAPNTC